MRGGELTLEDYAGHVGTAFVATDGEGQQVAFELIEAKPLKNLYSVDGEKRAPFALLFKSDDSRQFEQSIVELVHADMGTLHLFLVPVARDGDGYQYEATFN